MKKSVIKLDSKNRNIVEVRFRLTLGEALALKNALINYKSVCAQDVLNYLCNAELESKISLDNG